MRRHNREGHSVGVKPIGHGEGNPFGKDERDKLDDKPNMGLVFAVYEYFRCYYRLAGLHQDQHSWS